MNQDPRKWPDIPDLDKHLQDMLDRCVPAGESSVDLTRLMEELDDMFFYNLPDPTPARSYRYGVSPSQDALGETP